MRLTRRQNMKEPEKCPNCHGGRVSDRDSTRVICMTCGYEWGSGEVFPSGLAVAL